MAIQVWPDEATAHAYDERMEAWSEQNFEPYIRDRIRFEGEVDFWFQQIKYFGADAINVAWRWRLIIRRARRRSPPLPLQALALGQSERALFLS